MRPSADANGRALAVLDRTRPRACQAVEIGPAAAVLSSPATVERTTGERVARAEVTSSRRAAREIDTARFGRTLTADCGTDAGAIDRDCAGACITETTPGAARRASDLHYRSDPYCHFGQLFNDYDGGSREHTGLGLESTSAEV